MIRIRLILTVLGLLFVASLALARPAMAHDCDIYLNPDDCQNTAWSIGVIATLAGGVAVAAAATVAGGSKSGDTERQETSAPERQEPAAPPPPVGSWIEHVEIRPISDPPSVTIQPPDGNVRDYSVRLEAHSDPGRQTVQEVDRDHD